VTEAPTDPRGVIWLDAHITRRKVFHIKTDPAGNVMIRAREFTGILDELDLTQKTVYELALQEAPTPTHLLTIEPI